MSDVYPIGSNTVCARRGVADQLRQLGCSGGTAPCTYYPSGQVPSAADIAEGATDVIDGYDWTCPSTVYSMLATAAEFSPTHTVSSAALALAIRGRSQATQAVAQTQPQQRTGGTVANAVNAGVNSVMSKVDDWSAWLSPTTQDQYTKPSVIESTGQSTGTQPYTSQEPSTPAPVQASIIPQGWGLPLAIGGAVIVLGGVALMWYRNKRGY